MKADGKKDPAMLFYGADFYDDEAVKLMTLEQEAIYLRLLWHAWREGSIPCEVAAIAAVVGVPMKRFAKLWPAIAPKWTPNQWGRLTNRRQEHERKERAARTQKLADAGIEGARRRWGGHRNAMASPPNGHAARNGDELPSISISNGEREKESARARDPEPEAEPTPTPPGSPGAAEWRRELARLGVLAMAPAQQRELAERLGAEEPASNLAAYATFVGGTGTELAARLCALLRDPERLAAANDLICRREAGLA